MQPDIEKKSRNPRIPLRTAIKANGCSTNEKNAKRRKKKALRHPTRLEPPSRRNLSRPDSPRPTRSGILPQLSHARRLGNQVGSSDVWLNAELNYKVSTGVVSTVAGRHVHGREHDARRRSHLPVVAPAVAVVYALLLFLVSIWSLEIPLHFANVFVFFTQLQLVTWMGHLFQLSRHQSRFRSMASFTLSSGLRPR